MESVVREPRVSKESRPVLSDACIFRKQGDEFLIYNSPTDQMHLVSKTGWFVLHLCDGLRTIAELREELINPNNGDAQEEAVDLERFITKMGERGILKGVAYGVD